MGNKNNLIQSYTHASNQASSGEEELACFPTTGTLRQKTQNPKVDLYVFVRIYVCRGDTRTSSYPWANNALNCAPRSLVLSLAMVSFLPLLPFLSRISFSLSLSLFSFLMNFLEILFLNPKPFFFFPFFSLWKSDEFWLQKYIVICILKTEIFFQFSSQILYRENKPKK